MRSARGFSVPDILVSAAIIATLVALLMPSLHAYKANVAVRTSALQAVSNLRQAQQYAIAQQTVPVFFYLGKKYSPPTGWQVIESPCSPGAACVNQVADVLYAFTVPPQASLVAYCNLTTFDGEGQAAVGGCPLGSAQNPGSGIATVLCLDNGTDASEQIQVTLATGLVQVVVGSGRCP